MITTHGLQPQVVDIEDLAIQVEEQGRVSNLF
jgi:hypothetical protein